MPDRQTGELTAQEAKACVYRAQGKSKSEAYRLAFTQRKCTEKSLNEQACQLFRKAPIQSRVRDLLASVKAADIITIGESMVELLDFKAMAIKDRAHAALANYKRMELQVLGALKDNVAFTMEARASDKTLLGQWDKDKAKLALAREMLGADDTFEGVKGAGVAKEGLRDTGQGTKPAQWGGYVEMAKTGTPSEAKVGKTGKQGKADKPSQAFEAGTGGEVTQPCVDAETPGQSHAALHLVPEAKDTFDA